MMKRSYLVALILAVPPWFALGLGASGLILSSETAHAQAATSPSSPAPGATPTAVSRVPATPAPAVPAAQPSVGVAPSPGTAEALSLISVIRTTLRSHPALMLARNELARREALVTASQGAFDTVFRADAAHARERTPVVPSMAQGIPGYDSQVSDTTSLDLSAAWASHWGTTLTPSLGITRIHQRPGTPVGVPALVVGPLHQARATVTLAQALLRGAGSVGAASGIEAARLSRNAGERLAAHAAQAQVLLAVTAYWDYVAATESLAILRETERSALKLLEDYRELVKLDERPASDLERLEGNLAEKTLGVEGGMSAEEQARLALCEAMGLDARALSSAPTPTTGLPTHWSPRWEAQAAVAQSLGARQDLQALRLEVESSGVAVRGAEKNTQPDLTLSVWGGYNAAVDDGGPEGFLTAPVRNIPGASGGIGLSLELPVQNTARRAERDARVAEAEHSRIALSDLERRLPLDVSRAINDLHFASVALVHAESAVQRYERALENERTRLRAGEGTVVDILFSQEQLLQAREVLVTLRARCAAAATRLAFELGTLPSSEQDAAAGVQNILGSAASQETSVAQ